MVLEPRSGFCFDPVLVLDFQSLYPSIVIAHNLCFSTLLRRAGAERSLATSLPPQSK